MASELLPKLLYRVIAFATKQLQSVSSDTNLLI
eukprot:UN20901